MANSWAEVRLTAPAQYLRLAICPCHPGGRSCSVRWAGRDFGAVTATQPAQPSALLTPHRQLTAADLHSALACKCTLAGWVYERSTSGSTVPKITGRMKSPR